MPDSLNPVLIRGVISSKGGLSTGLREALYRDVDGRFHSRVHQMD